jgi:hypothetical protein
MQRELSLSADNSPPPVPILSQKIPLHNLPALPYNPF